MYFLHFEGAPNDPPMQKLLWSRLHASTMDWNFNPDVTHDGPASMVNATASSFEAVDQIARFVFRQLHAYVADVRNDEDPQTPTYSVSLMGTVASGAHLSIERIFGAALAAVWYQLQRLSVQVIAEPGKPAMLSVDVTGRTMICPQQKPDEARQQFQERFRAACPHITWEGDSGS